jgi:hypothetical protein
MDGKGTGDVRIGRREFLAKSAAAGAVVAGGGLTTGLRSALAASNPKLSGYAIGNQAADIKGVDQYNQPAKLSTLLGSWVLVDVCTMWCPACADSASNNRGFINDVNNQGINLKMFSVITEAANESLHTPSTQFDAERWAVSWGLEKRDTVIHCAGNPNSALRQLATNYAAANNNPLGGYPCYVLIDPAGVIRYYQPFADLSQIGANLSAMSGTQLKGSWDNNTNGTPNNALNWGQGHFDLTFTGGGPFSWTGPLQVSHDQSLVEIPVTNSSFLFFGDDFYVGSSNLFTKTWELGNTFVINDVTSQVMVLLLPGASGSFDSTVNVDVSLHPTFTRTYLRSVPIVPTPNGNPDGHNITVYDSNTRDGLWQYILAQQPDYTGPPVPFPQLNPLATGTVPTTNRSDGSVSLAPFKISDLTPGPGAGTSPPAWISIGFEFAQQTQPFYGSTVLQGNVNADGTLSTTTKSTVTSNLNDARDKMAQRAFSGAAGLMAAAATTLRNASAAASLTDKADSIADHVAWLAAQ